MKGAVWLASVALVLSTGVAVLHGPFARFAGVSCPLGEPTAAALETQRQAALAPLRGRDFAPARRFASVEIGVTSRVMVESTSTTCERVSGGALVRCADQGRDVALRFDPAELLVGFDRAQPMTDPASASARFDDSLAELERTFGPAHSKLGSTSASDLSAPLRRGSASWRFADLAIDLSVTHVGPHLVLREELRDVPRPLSIHERSE